MIAYEDDMGWKAIDLEKIDMTKGEWWSLDYLHYPEAYVKHTITAPIGIVYVLSYFCAPPLCVANTWICGWCLMMQKVIVFLLMKTYRSVRSLRVMTKENINGDFYENAVTTVPYADFADGLRVQQGGLIVEMIHPPGTNSTLFVTKMSDFNGQWKLQHQNLYIFDNKCGAPLLSPDGRYVAFTGESQSEVFIHSLDREFSQQTSLFLQSHEMNPEEVR
jgi:hypothetical protein